ncbi:MAG TPA: glycosyl transferase [Roseiarcus sp.]|jgi:predicted O-linked N-acetylglucosamine transferase (SPINDLY family)
MSTTVSTKDTPHESFDLARKQQLSLPELFQIAEGLKAEGRAREASELYKTWVAFNPEHSHLHLAYFNLSVALRDLGDAAGAINALRACVKQEPMFGPANVNLGRTLEDMGQRTLAIRQWQDYVGRTSSITSDQVRHRLMALEHIGRVFEEVELLSSAEDALKLAVELRPDKTGAAQHWIALRQRQCKWPVLTPNEHVSAQHLLTAMSPMALAVYADDPLFQLAKAYRYNQSFVGRPDMRAVARPSVKRKTGTGERLRVGYVSSDLRDHAVGFALREVFELHDKSRVEIFAYYSGDNRDDATQARMKAAVDHWRDIEKLTDQQAAAKIVADEIDILVDLNGYTKHARTGIFAYRPAPAIVNWCGYPGTMASPYHQYMIADDVIVPPSHELFYSEKVLRIPCNQPLDRKRVIDQRTPSRAEVGLPEDAFVYASFNGMQKLTANCLGLWTTILREVPNSVLWLLTGDDQTNERLRGAAAASGVEAERILFAKKVANPEHFARIPLADLFLDTMPYGAHSTAADALTMGLPVLTAPGRSFASRFCSSVVAAAGLREFICATTDEYVRRAVAFGRDRSSLAPYRDRLRHSRDASALRDIPALTRRLEDVFWEMQADCERGAAPIPDLTNLDVYYEIGAELDLENIERLDDDAYRRLYVEKLDRWNDFSPLLPDARFWSKRQ